MEGVPLTSRDPMDGRFVFGGMMSLRDQISGFFWLALAVFVCLISIPIGIGTFRTPGPGFLPFWAGVALGILSIAVVTISTLKRKEEGKISHLWKGLAWRNAMAVMVSLFLYTFLLSRLGYILVTSGLLIFLFCLTRRERIWIKVGGALMTAVASYLIFGVWLEVQLPKGIFGF
jgi:putative tricarboxylic transport membrane protein